MKADIKIVRFEEAESRDFLEWLKKSPEERLDTLQYLREMVYELKDESRKGFQRFLKITRRQES